MYNLVTLPPIPQNDSSDIFQKEFTEQLGDTPIDRLGHLFVRERKPYILCSWVDPKDLLLDPPLIFIDESIGIDMGTFVYGGLIFEIPRLIYLVLSHITNLIELQRHYPEIWPDEQPPLRLHLRDYAFHARAKTSWKHVPMQILKQLWTSIIKDIPGIVAAPPVIMPVERQKLKSAIKSVSPSCEIESLVPDLTLQAIALQMKIVLFHSIQSEITLDVIIDHDANKLKTGTHRKQATLYLIELLQRPYLEFPDPTLRCDLTRRSSSRFPSDFSMNLLTTKGYSVRPIIESLGLQLIDCYLGSWRQLKYTSKSSLKIGFPDLGNPKFQAIEWVS